MENLCCKEELRYIVKPSFNVVFLNLDFILIHEDALKSKD